MQVRALEHLVEDQYHRAPGDVFEVTAERAASLGSSVQAATPRRTEEAIEDVAHDRAMKPRQAKTR